MSKEDEFEQQVSFLIGEYDRGGINKKRLVYGVSKAYHRAIIEAEVRLLEKMVKDFSGEHGNMAVTNFVQTELQNYLAAELERRK